MSRCSRNFLGPGAKKWNLIVSQNSKHTMVPRHGPIANAYCFCTQVKIWVSVGPHCLCIAEQMRIHTVCAPRYVIFLVSLRVASASRSWREGLLFLHLGKCLFKCRSVFSSRRRGNALMRKNFSHADVDSPHLNNPHVIIPPFVSFFRDSLDPVPLLL